MHCVTEIQQIIQQGFDYKRNRYVEKFIVHRERQMEWTNGKCTKWYVPKKINRLKFTHNPLNFDDDNTF